MFDEILSDFICSTLEYFKGKEGCAFFVKVFMNYMRCKENHVINKNSYFAKFQQADSRVLRIGFSL